MRLEGRDRVKQTTLLLLGQLTGIAWETCESLADDPAALEAEEAFGKLIAFLDSRFRHDRSTELPHTLDKYLYRSRDALRTHCQDPTIHKPDLGR